MAGAGQFDGWGCHLINGEGCVDAAGGAAFYPLAKPKMAKAMKAPIRTKTEASRDVYDAVEGRAVRDEAVVQRKTRNRCHCRLRAIVPHAQTPVA